MQRLISNCISRLKYFFYKIGTSPEIQKSTKRSSLSIVEEDEEELIRSELASAEAEWEASRKISDHKEQQTDITFGQSNKKVQVDNTFEDQNSDVDEDVETASSVLSQSLRSTHSNNGGDTSRYI